MENQVLRRRVNIIASHLGAPEDISATATHLFPMSCSNSLSSIIRRCDNRLNFSRQSSSSQAYFMKQASTGQQEICGQASAPSKPIGCAREDIHICDAPMFSKPALKQEQKLHNCNKVRRLPQAYNYYQPTLEIPTFARPSRRDPHYQTEQGKKASNASGVGWLPKMDVAESGSTYVVTLELPGVNIRDIKVEVNNQRLRVTGKRLIVWEKSVNCPINSVSAYRRREISEGPYQIEWPLPENVKKDNISAELM
ncbi:OLC1v1023624C2 [Oldenlandia corymbosa var. corymbosa]|uniref:OLC1v1023624C2 n=1 Tax=Oldenlandia corymbosa var. corymbosa TaxID=529605 RepID=A0AAV1C2S3_OLDCO|nr:OLC1v1023624C2 [Oldenlandia corymbosa var. corymbosa]